MAVKVKVSPETVAIVWNPLIPVIPKTPEMKIETPAGKVIGAEVVTVTVDPAMVTLVMAMFPAPKIE